MSAEQKYGQKVHAEAGDGEVDSRTFKKAYQTVNHPGVTENLHEEYMKDPPHNRTEEKGQGVWKKIPADQLPESDIDLRIPKDLDAVGEAPLGVGEGALLGRPTRLGVERQMAEESEV